MAGCGYVGWQGCDRVTREATKRMSKHVEQLDRVVIRIAGDSGDGMQLTGDRFTQETAMFGNDLATFPTSRPRSARQPARWPVSSPSSSISPITTS